MTASRHPWLMLEAALATSERDPGDENTPKRRQVLDAAEGLFLGQGYGAVSMDAVARTAGVSKATLYAYFASKDALFATIVAERGMALMLSDAHYPNDVTDIRAALIEIGDFVLRFMLRERTLRIYRIAVAESTRFPELGRAFFENGPQRSCGRFQSWLARRQEQGLLHVPDLDMASQHFMSMLRGSVFLRATLGAPPPPDEDEIVRTVAAAVDAWLRAYGPPPTSVPA